MRRPEGTQILPNTEKCGVYGKTSISASWAHGSPPSRAEERGSAQDSLREWQTAPLLLFIDLVDTSLVIGDKAL